MSLGSKAESRILEFQAEIAQALLRVQELDRLRDEYKFVMLDGGLKRRGAGTGVGLYLAREAIRLHRGSLSVASEPGRGSVFEIRLPRSPEGS